MLATITGATSGETFQLTDGTTTTTFEYLTGTNTAAVGDVGFTDAASLTADIASAFSSAAVTGTTSWHHPGPLGTPRTTRPTTPPAGTASLTDSRQLDHRHQRHMLTVNDGSHTATFRYITTTPSAAHGTFTNAATLVSAINKQFVLGCERRHRLGHRRRQRLAPSPPPRRCR